MFKTFKNLFGGGVTTYSDDGKVYKTHKNVLDDGYTTYGSDGSTYKTSKNLRGDGYTTHEMTGPKRNISFDGVGGEFGGGLVLAVFAIIALQICANILTKESYIYTAAYLIVPGLSGIFGAFRLSRIWCSGALFAFVAYRLIESFAWDVSSVYGTKQGGEGLLVLIILFMILLVGIFFDIFSLGEGGFGFLAFFVIVVSLAWSYFNVFTEVPYTYEMQRYSIFALIVIALIDQLFVLMKR